MQTVKQLMQVHNSELRLREEELDLKKIKLISFLCKYICTTLFCFMINNSKCQVVIRYIVWFEKSNIIQRVEH